MVAHRDALVELAQFVPAQKGVQLRLPDQNDLDQLRTLRLQVRDEPDMLKHLNGEVLRLVDDQYHGPPGPILLQEEGVEHGVQVADFVTLAGKAELRVHLLHEPDRREDRVEDQRGAVRFRVELVQQRPDDSGLPRADFPRELDEARAVLDGKEQVRESLLVRSAQEEERRVRSEGERRFFEAERFPVHNSPKSPARAEKSR